MAIVRLKRSCVDKANMERVNELLGRFYSPNRPQPQQQLTGGSAAATVGDFQAKQAVEQLLERITIR